ncbi:MAG: hypothetical protein R3F59_25955 [Myxococcota bacterium]
MALRLAAVPVPADGTDELRAGVDLDRLDILFKASIEISGETAQLQDARVTLTTENGEDALELDAKCEDVETGDIIPVRMVVPVRVPDGVPARGGPRPVPTNEDDLDWEDETTLEQLVVNAPEVPNADEPDEVRPASGKGLQALLKALANIDDEDSVAEEGATLDEPDEEPEPVRRNRPDDDEEEEPEGPDQSLGAEGEARSLLQLLVDGGHVELEGEIDGLVGGVTDILALPLSPESKATRLSGWLLEQEQVADLYIDDDELAEILERW